MTKGEETLRKKQIEIVLCWIALFGLAIVGMINTTDTIITLAGGFACLAVSSVGTMIMLLAKEQDKYEEHKAKNQVSNKQEENEPKCPTLRSEP